MKLREEGKQQAFPACQMLKILYSYSHKPGIFKENISQKLST